MSKRPVAPPLAQPPWVYSPKEVSEWLESTASGRRRTGAPAPVWVNGFRTQCSTAKSRSLLRSLHRSGFEPALAEGGLAGAWSRLVSSPGRTELRMTRSGIQTRVRLEWRADECRVRFQFRPAILLHRAEKIVSNSGLRWNDGRPE